MTHSMQEADDVAFQTKLENTSPEKLMNQAVLILQKPFEARTKRDIEVLQKYSEKFEFFSNFAKQKGEALHAELCKHLNYEISRAGDTLFEVGNSSLILPNNLISQNRFNGNKVLYYIERSSRSICEYSKDKYRRQRSTCIREN